MLRLVAVGLLVALTAGSDNRPVFREERVSPNDNRRSAGVLRDGILTLRLEARVASWHPNGDDAPGADLPAFAEVGKASQIPGPLIRAVAGTRVSATIRNALPNDTLLVHGLYSRAAATTQAPPLQLLPGEERVLEFQLAQPGTYYYWATTMRRPLRYRTHEDSQLTGVIVVDPRDAPRSEDRIFVLGIWSDTVGGAVPHGRPRLLAVIQRALVAQHRAVELHRRRYRPLARAERER